MDSVKICVIGLGYVGLPLARLFSTKFQTVGFDMNRSRVDALNAGHDETLEVSDDLLQEAIRKYGFYCTTNLDDIKNSNFYVVAVPTPVDENNRPDLRPLWGASETVGKVISKGEGTLDIAAAQKDFVHIPITGSRIGISVYTSNKQRIRIFANFKYTTQLVEKNAEATKDLNEKVYAGSRLESDGDITGALYWYNLVANEQMPMGTSISDKNKRDAIITARKALGDLYSKGEGVGKDEGKARYWYDKANEYERLSGPE